MRVHVNGVERVLEGEPTIAELLVLLDLNRPGVAVAVNRAVVPRSEHASRVLADGDTLEVIRAVGGG